MTTMVRWNAGRWAPFREAIVMQNELSRLMNGLFEGNGRQTQAWVPMLDAWETESEVVYAFDLPGIPEDKVSVELDDGALTVKAEREREQTVEDGRYHRIERRFGTFSRTVSLPQGVTDSDVSAAMEHGVLKVHVRKPAEPQPRKIEIAVGGTQPTIEGTAKKK